MQKFGCTGLLMLVAGGILFAQRSQTPSADESKILALESARGWPALLALPAGLVAASAA